MKYKLPLVAVLAEILVLDVVGQVAACMDKECILVSEGFATVGTDVRSQAAVTFHVRVQQSLVGETLGTHFTP